MHCKAGNKFYKQNSSVLYVFVSMQKVYCYLNCAHSIIHNTISNVQT